MNNITIQLHWWSKSAAGLILGYTLALALNSLFTWISTASIAATQVQQFNIWVIAPTWLLALSTSYRCNTALKAWYWLSSANVIAYLLLLLTKLLLT